LTRALAIVTGGSTGIGHHLVLALAEAGYSVAFSYRSSPTAAEANVKRLQGRGHSVFAAYFDVGKKAYVETFHYAVRQWHGSAQHLLINNAGIQTSAPLLDLTEERWDLRSVVGTAAADRCRDCRYPARDGHHRRQRSELRP